MAQILSTLSPNGDLGTPTNGGARYTLLSTWEAAQQGVMTSADTSVLECYKFPTGCADTAVDISGWITTTATSFITIRAAAEQAHAGVSKAGFYLKNSGTVNTLVIVAQPFTVIQDIEVENATVNGVTLLLPNFTSNVSLLRGIFTGINTAYVPITIGAFCDNSIIRNNLFRKLGGNADGALALDARSSGSILDNNTVYAVTNKSLAWGFSPSGSAPLFRNNIFLGPVGTGGATTNASNTNNAFSSTGTFGASQQTGIVTTAGVDLVDVTAGNFNVVSGGKLDNEGANLYTTFTTDITNQLRPASGVWSIGAWAASGAPPTGVKKIYLGSTQLQSLKLGSTNIKEVYVGSTKVFG